jgi:UDP-glucose 4-epimerase
MRDFVFVDDAADAFLRAGASDACNGDVFNVGGTQPISHRDLAAMLVRLAGTGSTQYVDWPEEKRAIDIGSFYADSRKFSAATGWTPAVSLEEGFRRTIAFYREHFAQYVGEPGAHQTVKV